MEITSTPNGPIISDGINEIHLGLDDMVINKEMLKRYCDQARAYGWEAGLRYVGGDRKLRAVYESALENPFVKHDWDKELKLPQGFQLTFKENPL